MSVIDLSIRRLDDLSMSRALKRGFGRALRGDEMDVRMQFVRPIDRARARNRHGVVVAGAALSGGQIIPAATFEEMRAFDKAAWTADEDVFRRSGESVRD